jgi:hypothetical protein
MANINVTAAAPSTTVTVQDGNNITAQVSGGNNINLTVTPTPNQIIQINRGSGNNNLIAGYPVVMSNIQYQDVVMFGSNQWNNINQTEITDGGNF